MTLILDRVRAHAKPDAMHRLEVFEWGEPEQRDATGELIAAAAPLIITYTMVTLSELGHVERFGGGSTATRAAYLVAMKARDEKGERLFNQVDHIELRDQAAPEVVQGIAAAMLARLDVGAADATRT